MLSAVMHGRGALALGMIVIAACSGEERAEVRPEPRAPAPTKSAPREEREPAEPTAPARAPEAEADPEAPPAPVTVARADLPAGDSRRVVPMPERMRIRMGNLIRRRRHARPRILETLLLSREDGSATAYVLYQYSLWDACVHGGGSLELEAEPDADQEASEEAPAPTEEVRAFCRSVLESEGRMRCSGTGAFRAELAAPRPGTADSERGGSLVATAHADVRMGCMLETVGAFHLADWDGDGRLELLVDAWTHSPQWQSRGDARRIHDRSERTYVILREDFGEQVRIEAFQHDEPRGDDPSSPTMRATRVEVRDLDRDGHPDLRVETLAYWAHRDEGCGEEGADRWPARVDSGPASTSDRERDEAIGDLIEELSESGESWSCRGARSVVDMPYDAGEDRWAERDE